MTKLIDLSHRKAATDLLVDCAMLAVWHGYPAASRLLLDWMKHRSDDAAPILWIDALRHMRFEEHDDAEAVLRGILERDPDDAHAIGLLSHVLLASGQPAAAAAMVDQLRDVTLEPTAQALIDHVRTRRPPRAEARHGGRAHSVVIG